MMDDAGVSFQTAELGKVDAGGGGTIGPMLSADLGAVTVDIGNPMLSMHAVRELGGTEDGYNMVRLYTAFFEGK